jgi:hypothetical protein
MGKNYMLLSVVAALCAGLGASAFAQSYCPFRKLHPAWVRIVWQNQRMIGGDACNPELTWNVHRRLVQVAVPA